MEGTVTGTQRYCRPADYGVPLSAGVLEIESDRAPLVQPYQHELGGRSTAHVRDGDRYLEGTATRTGLRVKAILKRGGNELGERVSNEEMRALRIEPHAVCPTWNYTISPRPMDPEQIDQLICC